MGMWATCLLSNCHCRCGVFLTSEFTLFQDFKLGDGVEADMKWKWKAGIVSEKVISAYSVLSVSVVQRILLFLHYENKQTEIIRKNDLSVWNVIMWCARLITHYLKTLSPVKIVFTIANKVKTDEIVHISPWWLMQTVKPMIACFEIKH